MILFLFQIIQLGIPRNILYCNGGLGDDLLLTYVALIYQRKYRKKVNLFTNRPILFENHPAIGKIFNINEYGKLNLYLSTFNKIFNTSYKIIHCAYEEQPLEIYPSKSTHQHMYDGMLVRIDTKRPINIELKPHLFFKPTTINYDFKDNYIIIHSSSLSTPFAAKVKEWNMNENQFQIFIEQYGDEINSCYGQLVQIGSPGDPVLKNCIDLRGQTSLSVLISLVSKAKLFIGLEGGIMHLARAYNIPQIVIFGGRTMPQETGYFEPNIINLYSDVECSPCWNKNDCGFEHKCMRMITPEIVYENIVTLLQ